MKGLIYFLLILVVASICSCSDNDGRLPEENRRYVLRLLDEGGRFEKQEKVRQALVCYWDALDLLTAKQDTLLRANVYNRLGDLLFKYGLYEKAVENHREGYTLARHLADKQLLFETTRRLSLDYALLNQADTAHYFLDLYNRMAAESSLPILKPFAGKQLEHLVLQTKADSIGTIYEREQLLNWENKYKQQKSLLMQERARTETLVRIVAFLSVVCLLLVLLFVMYGLKKREQKRRREQWVWFNRILSDNKARLAGYQEELFNNRQHIRELQTTLEQSHASLQENESLHEELQYYMAREKEIREKEKALRLREKQMLSESSMKAVTLLDRMKNQPSYLPVRTPEEWQILTDFMDLLYDNYSRRIVAIKGMTGRDRELCYLMRLGFTTGQLAIFYGISPGSVTKAKYRIQRKLEAEGETPVECIRIA